MGLNCEIQVDVETFGEPSQRQAVKAATLPTIDTLAELLERLGSISPARVRFRPPPGTAKPQDVVACETGEKRLCELVDGVLVEKAMGYYESRLAAVLLSLLEVFCQEHNIGIVLGADATTALAPGLVRLPDVSFVSRLRLPGGTVPREPIPDLAPDLAVEVISQGNTPQEMERKLREYFEAGVNLVWYVYPQTRTVRVYRAPGRVLELSEDQTLDGGDVLPGFAVNIRDWFRRAE
jgi:Uma2 family endonuclease